MWDEGCYLNLWILLKINWRIFSRNKLLLFITVFNWKNKKAFNHFQITNLRISLDLMCYINHASVKRRQNLISFIQPFFIHLLAEIPLSQPLSFLSSTLQYENCLILIVKVKAHLFWNGKWIIYEQNPCTSRYCVIFLMFSRRTIRLLLIKGFTREIQEFSWICWMRKNSLK